MSSLVMSDKINIGVTAIVDDQVLPFLNFRGKHIYSLRPPVDNANYIDAEQKVFPAVFMQAIIETPGNEEVDLTPYIPKFVRFFGHCVKENLLDFGILCPLSTMEITSYDNEHKRHCRFVNGEWKMSFLSQPTEELIALANVPFTPEQIVKRNMLMIYPFASARVMDIAVQDNKIDHRIISNTIQQMSGLPAKIFWGEGELPDNNSVWDLLR
jgi:hypothetical protein